MTTTYDPRAPHPGAHGRPRGGGDPTWEAPQTLDELGAASRSPWAAGAHPADERSGAERAAESRETYQLDVLAGGRARSLPLGIYLPEELEPLVAAWRSSTEHAQDAEDALDDARAAGTSAQRDHARAVARALAEGREAPRAPDPAELARDVATAEAVLQARVQTAATASRRLEVAARRVYPAWRAEVVQQLHERRRQVDAAVAALTHAEGAWADHVRAVLDLDGRIGAEMAKGQPLGSGWMAATALTDARGAQAAARAQRGDHLQRWVATLRLPEVFEWSPPGSPAQTPSASPETTLDVDTADTAATGDARPGAADVQLATAPRARAPRRRPTATARPQTPDLAPELGSITEEDA